MLKMTRAQYDRTLDEIYDRFPDSRCRERTVALESFKATAQITETAPARPAPSSAKPKPGKRAQRIARAVRESLTAAAAPNLPPGVHLTAKPKAPAAPKPAKAAPAGPLHQLSSDQLGALTTERMSAGADSPFWQQPRETTPAASVTETAPAPGKPLHEMTPDELHDFGRDAFAADARARRLTSPIWAA